MIKNIIWRFLTGVSKVFVFALFLFGCSQDPILWETKSDEQVITQYINSNAEFSEFGKVLESSGLSSLLSVRGPFTLFLPSNEVMQQYYTEKGVTSFTDFADPEFAKKLVFTHLIAARISTGDIGLGAIRDTNAMGDYLVTEFDGSEIMVNKNSKIIKRDIVSANGMIHLIDKVIDPVTISVYDLIANNDSYKLFTQGMQLTKLKDTLKIITFPYGKKIARTRFTVLAVPDTTFNRYGITTIDQLVARYTSAPDSVSFMNNGFYRYMEYHCMGGTYFLNNFKLGTFNYPILSNDNNISITIDTDYKLNLNKNTGSYTGFVIDQSNNPAKNGTVHTINDLLPVFEPAPTVIVLETTDYFDMKQGDYFDKYYMRWYDGQNTFANIKWEGDYLLYYWKNKNTGELLNDDCLSMSGWWWVEITTAKIMKGKYKMTANLWNGNINYSVYVDGVNSAQILSTDPAKTTSWGEFDWPTTCTHKIKVVATSPGMLFWDTVILTPIK
jgi:uncharacterized surface protein with fasciclin (FAS1) repeats